MAAYICRPRTRSQRSFVPPRLVSWLLLLMLLLLLSCHVAPVFDIVVLVGFVIVIYDVACFNLTSLGTVVCPDARVGVNLFASVSIGVKDDVTRA